MLADIVFFVFLYQKWVYKVDHRRVNEFGFSGEDTDTKELLPAEQPAIEGGDAAPVKSADAKKTE